MSQIPYRGNLSSQVFPLISEYQGRTVIVGGIDQSPSNAPQIYYGHNIMPCDNGFQSVGYIDKLTDTKSGFENIFSLQSVDGTLVDFSHTASGANYVRTYGATNWTVVNTIAGTAGKLTTVATINGQTFVFFERVGCFMYDVGTGTLIPITLSGLDVTTVIGVCEASGYMLAWTTTAVAWSSSLGHLNPTDPIDFVPSLATGAGGGNVESARGQITLCVSHKLGVVIYTTQNAVAMVYSGNSRYPFNFREITATGGLKDQALVSVDSVSDNHYAYTTSGLQLVGMSGSQTVFPDITDFLCAEYFEDFNETSLQFESQKLSAQLEKALTIIADRYLVISYGVTVNFTHAIVIDLITKRVGKLKVNHVACFNYSSLSLAITDNVRESIGLLQSNGTIKVVDLAYKHENTGILLLGKYQVTRTRLTTLQEINTEIVNEQENFQVYTGTSLDGKTISSFVPATKTYSNGAVARFNCRVTGINHSVLFKGGFYATSLELQFTLNGRR